MVKPGPAPWESQGIPLSWALREIPAGDSLPTNTRMISPAVSWVGPGSGQEQGLEQEGDLIVTCGTHRNVGRGAVNHGAAWSWDYMRQQRDIFLVLSSTVSSLNPLPGSLASARRGKAATKLAVRGIHTNWREACGYRWAATVGELKPSHSNLCRKKTWSI